MLLLLIAHPANAQEDEGAKPSLPPWLTSAEPPSNSTVYSATPTIRVTFAADAAVDPETVRLAVGVIDMTDFDAFVVNATGAEVEIPSIFALKEGTHNVTVTAETAEGEQEYRWSFSYSATPPRQPGTGLTAQQIILAVLASIAVLATTAAAFLVYLKRTRKFTLRKYFARNPVRREYLALYVPVALATIGTLVALLYLDTLPFVPSYSTEVLVLAGAAIGFGPYALDVQHARFRRRAFERAYAQFLFELSDAMRGGIDPLKAVTELAKSETGVMRKPLRIAADGIRLGRPFDAVMVNMVRPMRSPLVARYAALVGEAAKVGGQVASVVHRAAKDMDDMVKIDRERSRLMKTPVITMYIAFGVLLLMVKSLMDFAPDLANTDFGSLSLTESEAKPKVPRIPLETLQHRFFHLTLLTSLGTGLLVGSFTEGRLRNGMLHAFAMVATATVFFFVAVF